MANAIDNYKTLYMFLRAIGKAYKWDSGHYFVPIMSVTANDKFPGYKTVKIEVEEMKVSPGKAETLQRFGAQSVANISGAYKDKLFQKAIDDTIEELMIRMIEHYGTTVQ